MFPFNLLALVFVSVLLAATVSPVHSSNRHSRDTSPRPAKLSPSHPSFNEVFPHFSRPPPTGETSIHDPSGVVYDSSSKLYYQFGTGLLPGEILSSHVSQDGYSWKRYSPVFTSTPDWVFRHVPTHKNGSNFWAPDVLHLNGQWHLYYAVSSFGSYTSCIGVTTNKVLDSSSSEYEWVDHGPVLCSSGSEAQYNCIDPHVSVHPTDGTVWMNYGSDADGVFVTQLVGRHVYNRTVGPNVNIAQVPGRNPVVEASWIQAHAHSEGEAAVYWLFVNWGQCCAGVNSTYRVKIGRSSNITGPYLDFHGVDMVAGGGTLLLDIHEAGRDRQVGPGQVGFPTGPRGGGGPNGNYSAPVISYHFYDRFGDPVGARTLGQAVLVWGDGHSEWPHVEDRLPA